jgi:hypothetical protein
MFKGHSVLWSLLVTEFILLMTAMIFMIMVISENNINISDDNVVVQITEENICMAEGTTRGE